MAVRREMPRNFVERSLERGRSILLLDGLDEVSSEKDYESICAKINDAKQMWPGCRIVVTCRKAGWRGSLHPDFRMFVALPFESQQQHEFVHRWYAAILRYKVYATARTAAEVAAHASREANRLIALLRARGTPPRGSQQPARLEPDLPCSSSEEGSPSWQGGAV